MIKRNIHTYNSKGRHGTNPGLFEPFLVNQILLILVKMFIMFIIFVIFIVFIFLTYYIMVILILMFIFS